MADRTPSQWFDALNAKFTQVSGRQWQDGRLRPGVNGASRIGATWSRTTTPRNQWLDTLWSYNTGDPPLPQVAQEFQELFRDVLRKARSNYAPMCLGATTDRMELQAVSTQSDQDADGDDVAADIMDESGFAAQFKDMLDYLFSMGEAYLMGVPGVGGGLPTIHAIDPRRCIGIRDPKNPTRLAAALVREFDEITNEQVAYMFLPGKKYEHRQKPQSTKWELVPADGDAEFETITGLDALGGIPIVRFDNKNGLGEYEPHIDLLDRINDTTLQRIVGFWYQALRQRAVSGDEDEDEDDFNDEEDGLVPDEDEKVKPVDWDKIALQSGPGSLWKFPKDFTIWESQQTDFGPFINAKRDDVKEFAALTSTPLYLVTPDDANGSALGAGLQRESATSKVRDRRARIAPGLKLFWRMLFALKGDADRGKRLRLHWGPIEFLSLAEQASASPQAADTLSLEDRCERIWQMSPAEIKRNRQRLDAERILVARVAATAGQPGVGAVPTARQQAEQQTRTAAPPPASPAA